MHLERELPPPSIYTRPRAEGQEITHFITAFGIAANSARDAVASSPSPPSPPSNPSTSQSDLNSFFLTESCRR